ncbi:hypothetical protein DFS34DRAFT_670174 [Phlyctochytrium arcticum]|nr:hypothetical protein DFS34DRAFT_670174 [Phlyctochytrium arcticum]
MLQPGWELFPASPADVSGTDAVRIPELQDLKIGVNSGTLLQSPTVPYVAPAAISRRDNEINIPEVQTYVVTFSKDLSATEAATIESQINTRGKFVDRLSLINGAVVRWNMNEIDALKNMAGVATVEKDSEVSTKSRRDNEMYIPEVQTYIITFNKDLSATEAATIESQINTRGKFVDRLSLINGAVVRWNMNEIDALKKAGVATVEKDTEVTTKN